MRPIVTTHPVLNLTKPDVGVTRGFLWKSDHHSNSMMSHTAGLVLKKRPVKKVSTAPFFGTRPAVRLIVWFGW